MVKGMKAIIIFLFLVGLISAIILGAYIFALVIFVFSDVDYPGDIAFVSKWIFLFSPLIFLRRRKEVQRFLGRLEEFFF
jgi:hypothetical protein